MIKAVSSLRGVALAAIATCSLLATVATGQSIDVALYVYYTNPAMPTLSNGTWQLVAKTPDSQGINLLNLYLTGVTASAEKVGPRGVVNKNVGNPDGDPAGFSIVSPYQINNVRGIVIGQQPVQEPLSGGEEQSLFYGVGTQFMGMPGDVGPDFNTLEETTGIPWADDPSPLGGAAWTTAAFLAKGTFAAGATPAFYDDPNNFLLQNGSVFTTVPLTNSAIGMRTYTELITTQVFDNLSNAFLADYNQNGIVDAADYTVWRDNLGLMGGATILQGDGTGDGNVTLEDYNFWKMNFGLIAPGPGGGGASVAPGLSGPAVPEPAMPTLLMGVVAGWFLARKPRHSAFVRVL